MRKINHGFIVIILLLSLIGVEFAFSKNLNKVYHPTIKRDSTWIDANQIAMMVMNNGTFARDPITGSAACYYPKGTDKTAIYAAGLWIAGKVNGEIRTACADYNTEYQPGVVLPDGSADNPDLEKYRVYKIKQGDAADPNDPNYNKDYAEWPVVDGAPIDKNGEPLILGDQTVWCVMNDKDVNLHNGAYNTPPLNIEVQLLAWAYDDDTTPLGKTVFLQYTIVNKGSETIEDAYIGLWSDIDLGNAVDDRCACDTLTNLSYVFNGDDFDETYGVAVPALGICLLQGPVLSSPGDVAKQFLHPPIQNAKQLNITSNSAYY